MAPMNPLGMVLGEPGTGRDAFRLEPDDDVDVLRVGMVADGPQATREAVEIDLPGSGVGPSGLVVIPAGIHPPVIEFDASFQVLVDEEHLVFRIGVYHLAELVRTARGKLRNRRQFPARSRHVVGEHPGAPHVLPMKPLAFPELQNDHGRAHFFSGQEFEMRQLLARAKV